MDPLTIAVIMGGVKLAQKFQSRSRSSSSPAPSSASCRWCDNPISGPCTTTACCNEQICQSCIHQWAQAGGKKCVLCGKTHA